MRRSLYNLDGSVPDHSLYTPSSNVQALPLEKNQRPLSLGEGFTPLIHLYNLGKQLGLPLLRAKQEGFNPTGSFKDRGMAVAIHVAAQQGARTVCLPSAGNAAGSASGSTVGSDRYFGFGNTDQPDLDRQFG